LLEPYFTDVQSPNLSEGRMANMAKVKGVFCNFLLSHCLRQ